VTRRRGVAPRSALDRRQAQRRECERQRVHAKLEVDEHIERIAANRFRHFGDAYAILLLSLWIGIGFIFQGVSAIAAAIGESELPGRGWSIVLGVISVIAGLVVLVWPFDSIVVLVVVAGVWLVILGVVQIIHSFQIRRDAKTLRDVIDSASERLTARQ